MKFHKFKLTLKREDKKEETTQAVPSISINAPLKVEDPGNETLEEVPSEEKNKKWFVLGCCVAIIIIILSIVFAVYLFKNPPVAEKKVNFEKPAVVEEKKTETVTSTFNRGEWSLEILNGSGVKGSATTTSSKLENLGYKIIKTGNADKSNYLKSKLYVSSAFSNQFQELLNDLKEQLSISTISGELTGSTASARIIVGKE